MAEIERQRSTVTLDRRTIIKGAIGFAVGGGITGGVLGTHLGHDSGRKNETIEGIVEDQNQVDENPEYISLRDLANKNTVTELEGETVKTTAYLKSINVAKSREIGPEVAPSVRPHTDTIQTTFAAYMFPMDIDALITPVFYMRLDKSFNIQARVFDNFYLQLEEQEKEYTNIVEKIDTQLQLDITGVITKGVIQTGQLSPVVGDETEEGYYLQINELQFNDDFPGDATTFIRPTGA